MRTTHQVLSDVEINVQVEIPAPDVDRTYDKRLRALRKKARIKGFRPGKAPRALVEKMFAERLANETAVELIESSLKDALGTVERGVIGDPQVQPSPAKRGQPLTYDLRLEVKPIIDLGQWRGLEVSVPVEAIGEEDVQAELERIRLGEREQVPVEDRGAEIGDLLVIDTRGEVDGETDDRLSVQGLQVRIGGQELLPGLADGLMGASAGEERTVEIVFPEDFDAVELQSKVATLEVKVNEHFVEEIPDLDDDLAQDVGYDDLAALEASTRERLETGRDTRRQREADGRLVDVLLERHPFQAPQTMVRAQLDATARRTLMSMVMRGIPMEEAQAYLEKDFSIFARASEQAVRRMLALEALAEQEGVEVDDEALDAEIVRRIQTGPQGTGERFDKEEAREALRMELREDRVLGLLRSEAKILDAAPEVATDAADGVEPQEPEAAPEAEPAP